MNNPNRILIDIAPTPDASGDWFGEPGEPIRIVDILVRAYTQKPRRMSSPAWQAWGRAYNRGLVSESEYEAYCIVVDTHAASWKGWLRWLPKSYRREWSANEAW